MLAVFDIDGVVADVGHRLHHLNGRRDWSAFFQAAADDVLLDPGARLVADLAGRHELVWLSGRPEWLRSVTATWLAAQGLPGSEVHLRPNGDHRPAPIFKLEVLARLRPRGIAAVVDDDPLVIDAALSAGYPAQLVAWTERDGRLRAAQDEAGRT